MVMTKSSIQSQARTIDLEVGKRIRSIRNEAEISMQTLAPQVGVSWQQLAKYERAENRVSAGRLWLIAKALGQPMTAFIPE